MKKIIALLIPLLLFTGISTYAVEEKIVLIDAGHGGYDGGAKSKNGTIEKNINLQIALLLKEDLEKDGFTVYMTRDEDKALSNKKKEDLDLRCKMKKDTMCHVFISVHQNKFPQVNCYGAQVWYADNEKSGKLANSIQNGLKQSIQDNNKRVAKCAKKDYRILRDGYDGASVIVECGFISNPNEEEKLKTEEHQKKISKGIVEGVKLYFSE